MAGFGSAVDTLINSLKLDSFYPEKLTREHLYEITELSLEKKENVKQETIAWYFLNRLTRLNYHARSIKLQKDSEQIDLSLVKDLSSLEMYMNSAKDSHPLDILVAVFLCCDPIAKQDFVKYLWDCKLAVPFILRPDKSSLAIVFNWPLKQLVSKCKEKEHKLPTEFLIYEKPMQKVGFIRLGNDNESKSELLNGIIGGPEKTHPMFFHRNLPGSKKTRSKPVDGLIEIGWYFPKGSETDIFDQPLSFANLRGDILCNKEHMVVLCDFLNIVVIISYLKHFENNIDVIEKFISSKVVPIVVITDQDMDIDDFKKIMEFGKRYIGKIEVILFNNCMLPEKLERITDKIKGSLLKTTSEGLDLFCKRQLNGDKCTVYDTLFPGFQRGIGFSEKILQQILAIEENNRTRDILPLQGEPWKKWTKADIEKERLEQFLEPSSKDNSDTKSYREKKEMEKQSYRQEQFDKLQSLSCVMKSFMLAYHCLNEEEFAIFLRSFIIGLDTISREAMQPYLQKYNKILDKKTKASPTEIEMFNKQIDALDTENAMKLFGIEHIIRELGQIFESCSSVKGSTFEIQLCAGYSLPCSEIPAIAANILLLGYPIEIMDGDVGFIPELFVSAMLNKVQEQLKKNREGKNTIVHVLSVLGLQSSGKSTLLNTMFGLKFSVGSGRCTKGVFMQIVKVSKTCLDIVPCDYLIVLDTEGLKASKRNTPRWKEYEHELSCFAMGMADTTIINIMGEHIQYLEEDLPIAVHAFLRMDMIGLKSRGAIFYNNVDKNNHDKLMEQGHQLDKILNTLTANACKLESVDPPKCFREIIDLDAAGETNYIPSLLDGELPMAAISLGYSKECNDLRKQLLEHINKNSRKLSILEFANHVECLWGAIKTEKFVFHFKSVSELQAKIYGDELYWTLYRQLWDDKCSLVKDYRETIGKYSKQMAKDEISKTLDKFKKGFSQRWSEIDQETSNLSLTANTVEKFENELLVRLQISSEELSLECSNEMNKIFDNSFRDTDKKDSDQIQSDDIDFLEKMIANNKYKDKNDVWSEFKNRLISKRTNLLKDDLQRANADSERVLYDIFQFHHAIRISLEKTQVDLSDFVIKKEHIKNEKHVDAPRTIFQTDEDDCTTTTTKVIESTNEKLLQFKKDMFKNHCEIVKSMLINMKELTHGLKGKCTNAYFADLSVAIRRHTFDFIWKQNEIDFYLGRQKDKYMIFIEKILNDKKEKDTLEYLADKTYHLLIDLINATAVEFVTNRPLSQLKYKSKVDLIKSLMRKGIQDDDINLIKEYRENPKYALKEYIKANLSVIDFVNDVQSVALKKLQNLRETIAKDEHISNDNLLFLWVTDVAVASNISVPQSDNLSHNFHVRSNLSETSKYVLKLLNQHGDEHLKSEANTRAEREFEFFKESAPQDYIDRIIGCFEQCPFCNELCKYGSSKHDGPHEAITHRPLKFTTQTSHSHETCEGMLDDTLNISFRSSGRKVFFKQYKSIYGDWHISSLYDTGTLAKVWKWYYAQTRPDTEIPQSWKINKSVVVSELENDLKK